MPRIRLDIDDKETLESTDRLLGSDENPGDPYNFSPEAITDYVLDRNYYVGIISTSCPELTDNGDGTATIASCQVALRDNSNFTGPIKPYTIPEATFEFTDGIEEYVVADYNSGNPIYIKTTNQPNGSNKSLIYVIWRVGAQIHSIHQDSIGNGLPNKANSRILLTEPYAVSSLGGLIISETDTPSDRTILVTSAIVFAGVVSHNVLDYNSSTDDLYKVISTSSGWTFTIVTQYDNTHKNPSGSGEVEMGNNQWKYNLYYRSIGDDKDVFFIESEEDYPKASDARVASESGRSDDIPTLLKNHCLFIGRTIVQKGASSGETTPFIRKRGEYVTVIPDHNDTYNKQGGTDDEYYHLTSAEHVRCSDLPWHSSIYFDSEILTSNDTIELPITYLDGTSNAVSGTLPDATTYDEIIFQIKCINDTYTCTVETYDSQTIDGESNITLREMESITIQAKNGNWYII